MAERKAVNKYYPPDWTPNKGSINKYVGQHPLRERARKLKQGILVIRFELPYNIWCGGCGAHVGMGVRYNAEKKKVGNYYSTPIYRFRMKCHLCDNYFEIETDPKNCDYNVVSGARRKEERWEASATETVETTDKEDAKRMAIDAMFKLEHGVEDAQKSKKVAPVLHQLQEVQEVWKDDYSANKLLRKKFRDEKKVIANVKEADNELRKRASLDIPLVPEKDEDVEKAKKIKFYNVGFDAHKSKTRQEISTRSWFSNEATSPAVGKLPGISLRRRKSDSTEEKNDWKKSVVTKVKKSRDYISDEDRKDEEANESGINLQNESETGRKLSESDCSRERSNEDALSSNEDALASISEKNDRTANTLHGLHTSTLTQQTFASTSSFDATPSCSLVSSLYSDSDEISGEDDM